MTPLEAVAQELRALGFVPRIFQGDGFIGQGAVGIDYQVNTGRHKNRTFKIAIGFQEDAYPEYPPHFVYVANLSAPRLSVHSSFHHDGTNWSRFSVPPSDFWDSLASPEKNMKTYVNRHLARFLHQV